MNGMQFDGAATVTVGGEPATGVNLINEYNLEANAPALPPGSINDIVVTNPSGLSGTLPNGYVSLFSDVDPGSSFRPTLAVSSPTSSRSAAAARTTVRSNPVTRQQMAVFLLRGKLGVCYLPPPCTGTVFDDVPCAGNSFAPWVEALASFNITGGCGGEQLLPDHAVNRQQMAVFLLKGFEGSDYVPPACTVPTFNDVPCTNPFAPWINELAARAITGAAAAATTAPELANREQMAVVSGEDVRAAAVAATRQVATQRERERRTHLAHPRRAQLGDAAAQVRLVDRHHVVQVHRAGLLHAVLRPQRHFRRHAPDR